LNDKTAKLLMMTFAYQSTSYFVYGAMGIHGKKGMGFQMDPGVIFMYSMASSLVHLSTL